MAELKTFFAGDEASSLVKVLGCDISIPLLITDKYGVPVDVEPAVALEAQFFTSAVRTDTPDATLTPVARAGVLGWADLVIPDTGHGLLRDQYWVWIKRDNAGDVCYSFTPSTILFK